MEDEQSTGVDVATEVTSAEPDPILDALAGDEEQVEQNTDDQSTDTEEVKDAEAAPAAEELPEEEAEDLQPEDDPKEIARRAYEERQRARAEREARVMAASQEYVSQAEDDVDQRLRTMEAQEYNRSIEHVENTLIGEFERAKADPDLQLFNPENKESFNQRAYDKAMRDYNAGYIDYDANGNMVGIKGSLIEHLKETAELLNGAVRTGAVQQVRATRTMRNNADVKPAATPKAPQKDTIMEILKSD